MAKGLLLQHRGQNLPADVAQLVDQLERHCLAADGSLVSKSAYVDLRLAREEMCGERLRYLEAAAIYGEATAMVEEYHQRGLENSPREIYETLEHSMIVAEAAQRLRLPLISKDGEIHEEEIERCSLMSRSSLDSTCTGVTISSSSNSPNYTTPNSTTSATNNCLSLNSADVEEPGVGGAPNCFLGITPAYLWQTQFQQTPFSMDMIEYRLCLSREIGDRLQAKCDIIADAFEMDDIDSSPQHETSTAELTERIKLMIEEVEREEAALEDDLYSADKKFAEYNNVLEQILEVLIKMVNDMKLQHQHNYDELQKAWLSKRCETIRAKLRKLEYAILAQTYNKESVPALHKIRKYLYDATEETSITYNTSVTRLREYLDVDFDFDEIAREYRDIVKKLDNMKWTINQVEMDLNRLPDNA